MNKDSFTKGELVEIEKMADYFAMRNPSCLVDIAIKVNDKDKAWANKLIKEAVAGYEMWRTISAKCAIMRGDKK